MRSGHDTRNSSNSSKPFITGDYTRQGLPSHVTGHHPEPPTCTTQDTVPDMDMVMDMVMEAISDRVPQLVLPCLF